MTPEKIFIIACETSGDMHAAHLIRELKRLSPNIEIRGLGGPNMRKEGADLIYDMTEISALGLGDVIRLYFKYRSIFYKAFHHLKTWHADAVILIDSPAFNLRFAKKVKSQIPGLPIYYYICPQLWAWGAGRMKTVKKTITKLFSILPFETEYYRKAGADCEFVGHPLLDHEKKITEIDIENFKKSNNLPDGHQVIGILPGSRAKEVERILPVMLKTAALIHKEIPNVMFLLGLSQNVDKSLYKKHLDAFHLPIKQFSDSFDEALAVMDFALVASGTATLQTALAGTPLFLIYKASLSTYLIGKQLIKVPYLGLVNLLAQKSVIPEFIQGRAHPETIAHEAVVLLKNPKIRSRMKEEFRGIKNILGSKGASQKVAERIVNLLGIPSAARQIRDKTKARS